MGRRTPAAFDRSRLTPRPASPAPSSLHEHQHQPLRIVLGVAQRIVDRRAQLGAHMDDALLRRLADLHHPDQPRGCRWQSSSMVWPCACAKTDRRWRRLGDRRQMRMQELNRVVNMRSLGWKAGEVIERPHGGPRKWRKSRHAPRTHGSWRSVQKSTAFSGLPATYSPRASAGVQASRRAAASVQRPIADSAEAGARCADPQSLAAAGRRGPLFREEEP